MANKFLLIQNEKKGDCSIKKTEEQIGNDQPYEKKGNVPKYQYSQIDRIVNSKHGKISFGFSWTLTTSILANWMNKVGTISKSDVKQKEKKP